MTELQHYGVKGMKWGKRKSYSTQDIQDARIRTQARVATIERLTQELNLVSSQNANSKKTKALVKQYTEVTNEFLANPDRATAHRMTRGEKTTMALVAAGSALTVAGLPVTAGVGLNAAMRVHTYNKVSKSVAAYNGKKTEKMYKP